MVDENHFMVEPTEKVEEAGEYDGVNFIGWREEAGAIQ
jgi:hypothetical protein